MKTKKTKKKPDTTDLINSLGIEQPTKRDERVGVYMLWWHLRSQIDHMKYPNAKWKMVEESDMYADWNEADKVCRKLEKKNPTMLYSARMRWVNKSELSKKLLKKIEERGW